MVFLTTTDVNRLLKPELQTQLTGGDASLLDEVETTAIAEVRSYLSGLYDADAIFAETGTDRHPMVVQAVADVALYHLFSRVNPNSLPELREKRYQDALSWLKVVVKGERSAGLPAKVLEDGADETDMKYGGLTKQDLTSF